MILYKRYKFAFQHVNRCGGTTVKKLIGSLVGPPDKGSAPDGNAHQILANRLKAVGGVDNLSIYANIRDPFSRLVSIFAYRQKKGRYIGKDFKWFFHNIYIPVLRPPSGTIRPLITRSDGKIPTSLTIVKIEDIDRRWPGIIFKHFAIKPVAIPRRNSSSHGDPLDYFDNSMIKTVIDKERWTIKNFYPKLLRLV